MVKSKGGVIQSRRAFRRAGWGAPKSLRNRFRRFEFSSFSNSTARTLEFWNFVHVVAKRRHDFHSFFMFWPPELWNFKIFYMFWPPEDTIFIFFQCSGHPNFGILKCSTCSGHRKTQSQNRDSWAKVMLVRHVSTSPAFGLQLRKFQLYSADWAQAFISGLLPFSTAV